MPRLKIRFIEARLAVAFSWQILYCAGWQFPKIQKLFDRIASKTSDDRLSHTLRWCQKKRYLTNKFYVIQCNTIGEMRGNL